MKPAPKPFKIKPPLPPQPQQIIKLQVKIEAPASILTALQRIERHIQTLGEQMALDYAKLEAAVAKDTDAENAAITLLTQLSAAIADLKTQITDPAAQATLDAFAQKLEDMSAPLAAAVVANTPVA